MTDYCIVHGRMTGLEFVDGPGIHESRAFCVECREQDRKRTHPWAGNEDAERLRRERIEAGLSLRDTGELLGVEWMLINDVQCGKEPPPDDDTLSSWIAAIREHAKRQEPS